MTATVITVANRKGGVSKTVTAFTLANLLVGSGYKVLLVDMDSQANVTALAGADPVSFKNVYAVLNTGSTDNAIQHVSYKLYVISGSEETALCDRAFNELDAPYMLKEALSDVMEKFDYIVIDTAPALDSTAVMALTACDWVVIPSQADVDSLSGIMLLTRMYNRVKKRTNRNVKIAGVLITRFQARQTYTNQMADNIKSFAEKETIRVFKTPIRECVAVKEAGFFHKAVTEYAPKSTAACDYRDFYEEFKEIINNEKEI